MAKKPNPYRFLCPFCGNVIKIFRKPRLDLLGISYRASNEYDWVAICDRPLCFILGPFGTQEEAQKRSEERYTPSGMKPKKRG